jgi:SAM-dependent methyltransferase
MSAQPDFVDIVTCPVVHREARTVGGEDARGAGAGHFRRTRKTRMGEIRRRTILCESVFQGRRHGCPLPGHGGWRGTRYRCARPVLRSGQRGGGARQGRRTGDRTGFLASHARNGRSAVPEARFVEGDAMSLNFDDGSFDAVTIGFGMPHVPDPPNVLAEARRVLRPGGRLAFSVWCGPDVDTALGYVFGAIGRHGAPDIALPPGPGANDYADPTIAYPVLEKAGFAECRQSTVASRWQVDDPGAPYDFFLEGTARGGALLRPQPSTNAAAIRAAVVSKVLEKHGSGPVWDVPIPAVVTEATAV